MSTPPKGIPALQDREEVKRSASGSVTQPGTNVAAKRGLNRSILDAGWASSSRSLPAKRKKLVGS